YNQRIQRVDAATGIMVTVAGSGAGFSGDGGPATAAKLFNPMGVAVDPAGNFFIADTGNNRIRRVDAASGTITTLAGGGSCGDPYYCGDEGPATAAELTYPSGIAVDNAGNLFIADQSNQRVRKVDAATGTITTVAGGTLGFSGDGGPASAAQLSNPAGVAIDAKGNLFIADMNNHRIRRVDAATGTITTVAGSGPSGAGFSGEGGPAAAAGLLFAVGVGVEDAGNVFVAGTGNYRIRKVDGTTGTITTVAGTGGASIGEG